MISPLAERLRPENIDQIIGQEHLIGKNGVIRKMISNNVLSSFILWGPPGIGKTTLARTLSTATRRTFFTLSAINSGVKDIRNVIESAKKSNFFGNPGPVLFIDEIHRFSKSQQDALLGAVENGTFVLIGATTENPSFEVIPALLSRCHVYVLNPLSKDDLKKLINVALETDDILKRKNIEVKEFDALLYYSGGDARKLLNVLETVVQTQQQEQIQISNTLVEDILQNKQLSYDKKGEWHYDVISAFIKSVRGSDADAAVYWLARMLAAGEDVKFIARRLLILAAEDIGLADPNALLMANTCFSAVAVVGMPEARIILSEATIYLSLAPKSNSAYMAINSALSVVEKTGNLAVPLHLRNAPTKLMKDLNYGKGYKYPHNYKNNYVPQQYLPDELVNTKLYQHCDNPRENKLNKERS